jgi:hypothetical protein
VSVGAFNISVLNIMLGNIHIVASGALTEAQIALRVPGSGILMMC